MINFIVITFVLLILFAVWNGFVILWYNNAREMKDEWRLWWHRIGFVVRFFLWIQLWLITYNWWLSLIFIMSCWLGYNAIINLMLNKKWYYVGTTDTLDVLIRKIFKCIKFDK